MGDRRIGSVRMRDWKMGTLSVGSLNVTGLVRVAWRPGAGGLK